jgi:hypothetical protein
MNNGVADLRRTQPRGSVIENVTVMIMKFEDP